MSNNIGISAPLYLAATLKATQGHEDKLLEALQALVPPSRAEVGCIKYDLHVDTTQSAIFVVYEIWKNQQALDQHASSNHFQTFLQAAEPLLAAPLEVRVLKRIDA
ncbi:putative quinol monooxygenase [Pseudomonas japonica]|uniref:putative quinol monooxygenase n=1 Tax=Pseudomonas japonica TaxID=256466 RepID=UPI0015E3A809|nr:putative quinol monooxygenase [Pseudomonas japonica]MBA1242775.1 antibiotic biosynthesis monooxygenase [Pseudomonas japonica]MBA1290642.1 antibiotic biosynthesis monooxygenase [Pseudomonas japonica]